MRISLQTIPLEEERLTCGSAEDSGDTIRHHTFLHRVSADNKQGLGPEGVADLGQKLWEGRGGPGWVLLGGSGAPLSVPVTEIQSLNETRQ